MGTLILHEVGALPHDDQRQLLEWLEPAARRVQVISTTSASLFPRVEVGAFSDVLYYRLNTMCMDVASWAEAGIPASLYSRASRAPRVASLGFAGFRAILF